MTETRPRIASDNRWIRQVGLSPSGKRAVVEYRGEIVTVPAKKGDTRNLTSTPGSHERSPAWSPDGKQLAFTKFVNGSELSLVKPPRKPKGADWADPPRITTRFKHERDGSGKMKPGFTHIFVVSVLKIF